MAGIVASYKKIFENKGAHITLFLIALIWTILSTLFDIASGKPENIKQNPVDLIFNLLMGVYSLQFLHNALNDINLGVLPSFKELSGKVLGGMIVINLVWGFYAAVIIMLSVILYFATHTIAVPIIVIIAILFLSPFINYIYLAFAEQFTFKNLLNIALIFKFIKPAIKQTYIKFLLFMLISLALVAIIVLIYLIATLTNLNTIGMIAKDYYILDSIIDVISCYFLIITWYLAFPYSLINVYREKISPLLREEFDNVSND